MDPQISTVEMLPDMHASHLGDVSVPGQLQLSTVVPIREEFRCRRWWFFYHDIRAFSTSWVYLPIFMLYRVLVFIYLLIWLILHIYARRDEFGPRWLIFITDLGYGLLTVCMGLMAIFCVAYGIVHYAKRSALVKFLPKKDFPLRRVYKQDNVPWYVKILWLLYIVTSSTAVLVFLGYWLFVYNSCGDIDSGGIVASGSGANSTGLMSSGSGSGSGDNSTPSDSKSCSFIDVHTVQFHGVNVVIVLLDLFISRVPYQFLHLFYPPLFGLFYIIFTLIYFGAGGTNHLGQPYIYSTLDYGNSPATSIGFAIIIIVGLIPIHLVFFLVAWLRDVIYTKIRCCFCDVRRLPFQESADDEEMNQNGVATDGAEEMTKV